MDKKEKCEQLIKNDQEFSVRVSIELFALIWLNYTYYHIFIRSHLIWVYTVLEILRGYMSQIFFASNIDC